MNKSRILPPTYLLIALFLMVVLSITFPIKKLIPMPLFLFGIIPLAIGIALNLIADQALKQAETTVKPFQESTTLITHSVYRVSRHPMYLGFVLILIGVALLLRSLSPWIVIPIFIIAMEIVFIRAEEQMLAEKFPKDWLYYTRKVRRWI